MTGYRSAFFRHNCQRYDETHRAAPIDWRAAIAGLLMDARRREHPERLPVPTPGGLTNAYPSRPPRRLVRPRVPPVGRAGRVRAVAAAGVVSGMSAIRLTALAACLVAVLTLGAYGPDGIPPRRAARLAAAVLAWAVLAWGMAIALPGVAA